MNKVKAGILSVFLAVGAHPIAAENVPAIFNDLVPPSMQMVLQGVSETDGRSRAERAVIRASGVDIGIEGLSMARSETGGIIAIIDRMTLNPALETAPRISASNFRVSLSSRPLFISSDQICEWSNNIDAMTFDVLQMETAEPGMAADRTIFRKGSFQAAPERIDCFATGSIAFEEVVSRDPGGRALQLRGIAANMRAAISAGAAATPGAPVSVLSMRIEEIEMRNAEEIPAARMSGTEIQIRADTPSTSGLLTVLRASNPFHVTRPGKFFAMQLANGFSMATGNMNITTENIRLHAAGVVPATSVANFSRTGMSTVSGIGSIEMRARNSSIDADISLDITGVGGVDFNIDADFTPYPREKLDRAARSEPMGFHAFPDISINRVDGFIDDNGFSRALNEITAVSPRIWFTDIHKSLVGDGRLTEMYDYDAAIGQFFDRLATGDPMRVIFNPAPSMSVLAIAATALGDPMSLGPYIIVADDDRDSEISR